MGRCRVLLLSLIGCTACAAPETALPWCSAPGEGYAVHVLPGDPLPVLHLEEVWSVGGTGDGPVFGNPGRPAVSAAGEVAVPDMMARTVVRVSAGGAWLGSVMGSGDGPGEVQWPVAVEWSEDGDLHVLDLADGAVITLDPESGSSSIEAGSWLLDRAIYSRIAMAGSLPGVDIGGDGAVVLELPHRPVDGHPTEREAVLVHVTPERVDTLQVQRVRVMGEGPWAEWMVPGTARPAVAVGSDGRIVVAGSDGRYLVRVLPRPGATNGAQAILCRDVDALPYSSAERGRVSAPGAPDQLLAALARADRPERPAALGGLVLGSDSRLWVLRDRIDPISNHDWPGGGTYEILTVEGGAVGTVRAPERVVLVGEGGGQVYGLRRGEYDEVELVAYRLSEGREAR